MAKAKLSGYFRSIQGKIGDMLFTETKYGTVMREDVVPANPRTAAQIANRNYFSLSARGYANLSPSNLALWRTFSAAIRKVSEDTGEEYSPNPFNVYMTLTKKFYAANEGTGTPPVTPPTASFAGDAINITATATTGKVTFTASAANSTNVVTELWLQPLRNANRKPSATGYRIKGYFQFVGATLSTNISVPAGVYAAGYRFVNKVTGQSTPFVPIAVTGVALTLTDSDGEAAPASKRKAA